MSHVTRSRGIGRRESRGPPVPVRMLFHYGQVAKKPSEGPHPEPRGGGVHNELPLFLCLALVSSG